MERIECCSFIITMKIFETERLTIRTLDENDIDRLVEYRSKRLCLSINPGIDIQKRCGETHQEV